MRFPWANTLLLMFLSLELVSGFFGLTSGSENRSIHMQLHRVAGYGILAILGWKSVIVVRSWRRPRSGPVRVGSLALATILLATIVLGLTWSLIGPYSWWLFSGVSWHIYAGATLVPFLIWHAWHMARKFPIAFWAERRLLLRVTGIAAAGLVAWQMSEGVARASNLSGSERRFTGSYEDRSFSGNQFPRVSWLNDDPNRIDVNTWTLHVAGAVDRELTITYRELGDVEDLTATIDCTGGWHSTQRWSGVPLDSILSRTGPTSDARSVVIRSVTGYYRRFSLDAARQFMLATRVTGETLSHGHGFPVRLVAPGRRGFEWVKWVTEIEFSEAPPWWQPPLPIQ